MMAALRFEPYPDAIPGLRALRGRGLTLVIASNWDCSLPDWLGPPGLIELVDGVVTSADVRAAKPDPAVFLRALELAGVGPERGASTWATRSRTTSRAPAPRGSGRCS